MKKQMKNFWMKISTLLMLIFGCCVMCFSSCKEEKSVTVESLNFSQTEIEIKVGETQIVSYTLLPLSADDAIIKWQSSNVAIATVNEVGVITGIEKGTCVITATAGSINSSIIVTVKTKGPDFKALYDALTDDYGWTLGADHSYLSADSNIYDLDDYSNSSIVYEIKDMNRKIGLPDSLYNDMIQTTWSMGKQSETYESLGVTVTWTYHPDKGLEVTYKLINN